MEKIRTHYNKVNATVAEAVKNKTSMYCNEVVLNKTGAVWSDVGTYQKTTAFWYSAEVQVVDSEEPNELLEKVTVKSVSASTRSAEEYLFYKGALVFYYLMEAYKSDKGPQQDEHRIYFNKGKLLKHDTAKGNMQIEPETAKAIENDALASAKKLQQLFKNSCDYEDVPPAN